MCNPEARRVEQPKTYPRYLTELAPDIIEGGSSPSGPRSVVGEDREAHVSKLDPLLSPGSAQYIHTVHIIVQTSDNWVGALIGFRLRLEGKMKRGPREAPS